MTSAQMKSTQAWSLMGQAELPLSVVFGEPEMELWPYRRRTVALLRRCSRASVEVGRLPSLLGREFFRSRVTSYTMRNFEDVVIFVTDMENAIEKLSAIDKKLLAMNILEEYTIPRSRGCSVVTSEWSSGFSRMHSISSHGYCLQAGCWKHCPCQREVKKLVKRVKITIPM